ncbi:MAG: hypothetical protein HQK72_16890 [Desulfamplus sp.]|nr:hypothetical protein [Desulfamplus sp.]
MLNDFLKFTAQISNLNCKDEAIEWLFYSGMLFGSKSKWWADWGERYTQHEGIDITFYRTLKRDNFEDIGGGSNIKMFDAKTKVPVIADGKILNICTDFLGQSVIIEHLPLINRRELSFKIKQGQSEQSTMVGIYSHIKADQNLECGMAVSKGDIIGTVADTSMRKSKIPPHLHISIAEISRLIPFEELNWNLFGNSDNHPDKVKFFNPINFNINQTHLIKVD